MADYGDKPKNAHTGFLDELVAGIQDAVVSAQRMAEKQHIEMVDLYFDDDTGELVCRACSGPVDIKGTKIKQGEGVVGKTVSEGLTVVVQDVNVDSFFSKKVDEATGFVTESLMCAPLKVRDKTFGALEVINKRGSGFFAGHDRVVITALASATAMASLLRSITNIKSGMPPISLIPPKALSSLSRWRVYFKSSFLVRPKVSSDSSSPSCSSNFFN